MNKFVFENSTKAYFGEGCVKEHLPRLLEEYNGGAVITNEALEGQDRAGLSPAQPKICPAGPRLHLQRPGRTDGLRRL